MESDLTSALMASRAAGTRQALDMAVLRKSVEADQQTVTMLQQGAASAETSLPPLPDGQGRLVDKLA